MKKSWIVIAAAVGLVIVGSLAVWRSSGDDSRRQGALGSQEAVALSWRGDWSREAEYTPGNVVAYEGASYVAEGEKLSAPEPGCEACGWKVMAMDDGPAPGTEEAPPAATGYEIITRELSLPPGQSFQHVQCSSPEKSPLGAGWELVGGSSGNIQVEGGRPYNNQQADTGTGSKLSSGWVFQITNELNGDRPLALHLTCAPLPQ